MMKFIDDGFRFVVEFHDPREEVNGFLAHMGTMHDASITTRHNAWDQLIICITLRSDVYAEKASTYFNN